MPFWVYGIVWTESRSVLLSFLKTSVIFPDVWSLLCLHLGHEGIQNVGKPQHECLQLSISPPFPFHQPILLPSLRPSPGVLEPAQRLVFTASAPLNGCPRARKSSQASKVPSVLLGNTSETLLGREFCALDASVFTFTCVSVTGGEGFCRERLYSF